jgi:hypothetical protein
MPMRRTSAALHAFQRPTLADVTSAPYVCNVAKPARDSSFEYSPLRQAAEPMLDSATPLSAERYGHLALRQYPQAEDRHGSACQRAAVQ